jgi:hypothetical protein
MELVDKYFWQLGYELDLADNSVEPISSSSTSPERSIHD